ncbi:MAG: hypothetical protein KAS72_05535 [Phycisphaerales bacterium]|nr:hypothetical protein [Phycisphaerales bacterium]
MRNRFDHRTRVLLLTVSVLMPLLSSACGTGRHADPAAIVLDGERPGHLRRAALQRVVDGRPSPERTEALRAAVADPAFHLADHRLALFELIAEDERAAEALAAAIVVTLPACAWADELCAVAAARGWMAMRGPIVRRIASAEPADGSSAARQALVALSPGASLREALIDILGEAGEPAPVRVDAWVLLVRLAGRDEAKRWLLHASPDDGMLGALHRAATELGILPATRDEIIWVASLLRDHGEMWRRWANLVSTLDKQQQEGLALRHLRAIEIGCDPGARSDLLAAVRRDLARAEHHVSASHVESAGVLTIDAAHGLDTLPWGELVMLRVLQTALHDPVVVRSLLAQAEADRLDETSEHGGLLDHHTMTGAGSFQAVAFPPQPGRARSDVSYQVSTDMIERGYTALAQYHFHAQRRDNRAAAGPGPGDLRYAARSGAACLVFTSVGRGRLNADYYARLSDGRVCIVDMGVIER